MHNRFATGVTIVLGTLVASALGILVTLATSDLDRWPGWLRPFHQWAWWTILALIAAACLLAVWERRRHGGGAGRTGGTKVEISNSTVSTVVVDSNEPTQGGDVHVVVVESTVGEVRITVTNQQASDPLPRIHGIVSEPIGRTREADMLLDRLRFRPDRSPIYVITGPPGVGKSTLAHFVANKLAQDYPHGQLTMQLSQPAGQQASQRQPDADELLGTMLAALGAPETDAARDQRLQDRYLREFGRDGPRRVLLLLEGAQTAEQVLPLRPPNGCAAIITSQHALPVLERDAMIPVLRLDTLSLWRSLAFLDRRIGRKRVARAPLATLRLAKACNGFPSALGAVSSGFTTASGEHRSVRHAMDLLREGVTEGLPEIEAAFAIGLEACERRQRKMFQVLGAAERPTIETAAAAAALGLPFEDASHQLRALADASLLQAVGPDRWQLHQLVRPYAEKQAGRLGDNELKEIKENLRAYEQARALVRDSPKERHEVRAWLQVERTDTDDVLKGVAKAVLDLAQAGLEGLASLLIEVISLNPRSRYALGTAIQVRAFADAQGQHDLVDRVDAWTRRHHPGSPLPRLTPAMIDDPGPQDSEGSWTLHVSGFQPGEAATLTVDGRHTRHTADAGGEFTCTFLPQKPCHVIAVGDAGSWVERFFC